MNVVMIIPTGIGCAIGGHAGDANPAAKLLGSVCDKLILHPNVVNASDINEMSPNALYVEGSILDRMLEGRIRLKEVKSNKILVVTNNPATSELINAVSAARATIGIDAEILELKTPLRMIASKTLNGAASGQVYGWRELIKQVGDFNFDALAISSSIECPKEVALDYLANGGVNPWGGVEAKASRIIAEGLDKPVAHAPSIEEWAKTYSGVVDPRMAAEMLSSSFMHCIFKGLHKAPQIADNFRGLGIDNIDCLVSPKGCWGRPHMACYIHNIPIIFVEQNTTIFDYIPQCKHIKVLNYIEAAGMIKAMSEGISVESVTRPLLDTIIKRAT